MYVADLGLFFCVAERAFRFPLSINLTEKKKKRNHALLWEEKKAAEKLDPAWEKKKQVSHWLCSM